MRIGIDCRTILNPESGERAGVGHYTFNLVRALLERGQEHEFVLFFDYRMKREAAQVFEQPNVKIRFLPFSSYGKFLPVAYSQLLVAAAFLKAKVDILHGPANVVPLAYPKPFVITQHDLAIYKHPEWFPTQMFSTRLLVPQSLKRARRVIAVSQATKNDISELFNVEEKKMVVIPEAADTELLPLNDRHHDMRTTYKLPPRYVLYVGTIEPRKNLPTLFRAWHEVSQHHPELLRDTKLILAGGVGFGGEDILPQIKKMKLGDSVRHLGYVSHNHKILLLRGATAFVFPTSYEGFGLPVLEAMQLGVPVVTTNTSSIPEVTGDAAVLTDPGDPSALADALVRVLTDETLRTKLSSRGKDQAKQFSWARTAVETLRVYDQAAR